MTEETQEEHNAITATLGFISRNQPHRVGHPTDRTALEALRKVPALDQVLKKVFGSLSERGLRLMSLRTLYALGRSISAAVPDSPRMLFHPRHA